MRRPSALGLASRLLRVHPVPSLPEGRTLELPGRGSTYVVDTGEPASGVGGPPVFLLHALACTGLLTWYPCLEALRRRYRVVVFDQRWHGQGICAVRFDLADCADDVVAVADALGIDTFIAAGYSMGALVSQLVWRRHPERVAGLVLCAGATHFAEQPRRAGSVRRTELRLAALVARQQRAVAEAVGDRWAWRQFRATTGAAIAGAGAVIARFDSRSWIGAVDVPCAVVVTARDRLIPVARQHRMARAIPDATVYEVDAGHACCVLGAERFRPAMLAAVASVSSRAAVRAR